MTTLVDLPTKLLQKIASSGLGLTDLASLVRTNKRLCRAITYVLYKSFGSPLAINFAVKNQRLDILRIATNFNLDINFRWDEPLRNACSSGYKDIATYLLAHGARVDPSIVRGGPRDLAESRFSPLDRALWNKHEDIALLLLSRGANPWFTGFPSDRCPEGHRTALHEATTWGLVRVVEKLVRENMVPIDQKNQDGHQPLHVAIMHKVPNTFTKLIELGADVEVHCGWRHCPLTLALGNYQYNHAVQLLDAGANPNPDNVQPGTCHPIIACSVAPRKKHRKLAKLQCEIFDIIVKAGAEINKVYPNGMTPLSAAVLYGSDYQVAHILSLGAEVDLKERDGFTPLNLLWEMDWRWKKRKDRNWERVTMLLRAGAELNVEEARKRVLESVAWSRDCIDPDVRLRTFIEIAKQHQKP
ncbi:ankyrin repeat-containing domain protein [Annulohypoxylon moriforme]|nr:ankyrin repeat-containing domain protein [Annulohypoxylon moriforme]